MTAGRSSGWHWTDVRRVTALGEPLLELQPGEGGDVRLACGGDVANSMVCLSRILGPGAPRISVVAALGDSSYSAWLRERLRREGLHVAEPPIGGEPGIYGLPLGPGGHCGFSYWREQSAARRFLQSADAGRFEELLGDPQVLLVTGITLALCSRASFEHLCRWVDRHRDCRVIFDCNFRKRLWESEAEARERIGAFEQLASLVATGTEDERTLWGAADTAQIIERVGRLPAEYLIRGGPEGCWVGSGQHCQHVETEPVSLVGDTAGAGDAHLAGYLAARISGLGRTDAAVYANKAAAVIVAQRGSMPARGARFPRLPHARTRLHSSPHSGTP
ncbi:MAG TPA: PfkB family carbohydrate kinase [Steroidobacteraceae bacterium]|nr:PfkB family carbohydrate kinase [Steroidobacteraceae bacterium]